MSIRTMFLGLFFIPLFMANGAEAADGVTLYTPYTDVSVPPGESLNYTVDVINNGNTTRNISLSVSALPTGWNYSLKAGGWDIRQLSVLPGEKKSLAFNVVVPLKVDKGNYHFALVARGYDKLPLTVNVSEKGTFKTEFTSGQANMEGSSKSTFTFRTTLTNETGDKQLYSLRADTPRGWIVTFKPEYKQATSVEIDPGKSKEITIDIKSPEFIAAGSYKIPVFALTSSTSSHLDLEVVITGTYDMELTTPTGLLSTSLTAGHEKRFPLLIKNTGSASLTGVTLRASNPVNWDVRFEPEKVDKISAGENMQVFATVKADKKAIAGDYAVTITASTPEASSNAAFRIAVKTPMLWGWVGILIIAVALSSVFYLFRKYGRR